MGSWMFKLLLLLQLMILLLKHADSSSIVRYLPGFQGPLPFELETGYVGVGEEEEEQMFYYFIKSESNPQEDPLLIWLSGGPGCSSLSGFLLEIGPLTFKLETSTEDIPSLVSTTYSWTKVASIIYLDQPVGTGFSYSRNPLGHLSSDSRSAKRVDEFLRNWLAKHPHFSSNPFYVAGNSYSGNCLCCKTPINLQGYVLGNPITDFENDYNSRIPYAHGMGLISEELYESLKRSCRGKYGKVNPLNTECSKLVQDFEKTVSGVDQFYILAQKKKETALEPNVSRRDLCKHWANAERVQRALQVDKGTIGEWLRCSPEIPYTFETESSVPYHKNNSVEGYRSLIFSGDHDMVVPFIATRDWIKSLNYSIVDDWRPWMINDYVAGYTRTYANHMTFATIRGGGHTPEYKPEEYPVMFERWISGQPL